VTLLGAGGVVSRSSPFTICLSEPDRVVLVERARAYTESFASVVRAKIVLLAAEGVTNVAIAARLDVDVDVVSKWRKRFFEEGMEGLQERKRPGRPRSFPP
jgi:transposase-like protein